MTITQTQRTNSRWRILAAEVAEPSRLERGIRYADEKRVHEMFQSQDEVSALVDGSRKRPYRVTVGPVSETLDAPDEDDLNMTCNCPDGTWVCKHIVAVMTELGRRAARTTNQPLRKPDEHAATGNNQRWDDDVEYDEYQYRETPPERWLKALPETHTDFWNPGPEVQETNAAKRKPTHLLDYLGEVPNWQAQIPFGTLMHTVYLNAHRKANALLERAENITEPDHAEHPDQRMKGSATGGKHNAEMVKKAGRRETCQCPECAHQRSQTTGKNQQFRTDTMLSGYYDQYLLDHNYEWTPCGRRLQPAGPVEPETLSFTTFWDNH